MQDRLSTCAKLLKQDSWLRGPRRESLNGAFTPISWPSVCRAKTGQLDFVKDRALSAADKFYALAF